MINNINMKLAILSHAQLKSLVARLMTWKNQDLRAT